MRLWTLAALSLGGWLLLPPPAPAGFFYRLVPSGSTTIVQGQTLTVNMYLDYDGTGLNYLATSTGDPNTPGGVTIVGSALRAADSSTGSVVVPTNAQGAPTITVNPDFPNPTVDSPPFNPAFAPTGFATTVAQFRPSNTTGVTTTSGPANAPNGGSLTSLYLGTITVQGVSPGVVNLQGQLRRYDTPSGFGSNIGTAAGTTLDSLIVANPASNLTINVTAVPEPASMALVGFGMGIPALLSWRKRRAAKADQTLSA